MSKGRPGGNPLLSVLDRSTHHGGANSELPNAFHNDHEPAFNYKKENHKHRLVIMMAAGGKTISEVASSLSMHPASVSNILRQPWARERMQQLMQENGEENIKELLKSAAIPALKVIIETSKDETVKPEVRLAASRDLVDRFLGKATQPITTEEIPAEQLTDEQLAKRIAERERN